jgi:hypothetical protein
MRKRRQLRLAVAVTRRSERIPSKTIPSCSVKKTTRSIERLTRSAYRSCVQSRTWPKRIETSLVLRVHAEEPGKTCSDAASRKDRLSSAALLLTHNFWQSA